MVAFTLGVSILTGLLFGVAPALRATRVDLNSILKGTATGAVGAFRAAEKFRSANSW